MKLSLQICLALLLSIMFACQQKEQKQPVKTPAVNTEVVVPDQFPDIQTLTENHQIMLIRVAGDLSKVPAPLQKELSTKKSEFEAAFGQFKETLQQHHFYYMQLDSLNKNGGDAAGDARARLTEGLNNATRAATVTQEAYNEKARQFAQIIEAVRKARGG